MDWTDLIVAGIGGTVTLIVAIMNIRLRTHVEKLQSERKRLEIEAEQTGPEATAQAASLVAETYKGLIQSLRAELAVVREDLEAEKQRRSELERHVGLLEWQIAELSGG